MFDFSFGELAMIGAVALVVLGPERLPKVARSLGEWAGKAQRYVTQVKNDINREMELAELKKLQEQARGMAREFETSVESSVKKLESDVNAAVGDASASASSGDGGYAWEGAGERWIDTRFKRRYKPGPGIDDLAEELAKLKRQLQLPESVGRARHKYAARARLNRPRIRR
jgi:sec-independent protein translocase protein TatB